MARHVHFFQPLWFDRHFKKSLKALSTSEQDRRLQEISGLIQALAECRHPCTDPMLASWRPSAYHVSRVTGLFEYRCRFPLRVIARWIEPHPPDEPEGAVLMVAATLAHDHERLQKLIAGRRGEILS